MSLRFSATVLMALFVRQIYSFIHHKSMVMHTIVRQQSNEDDIFGKEFSVAIKQLNELKDESITITSGQQLSSAVSAKERSIQSYQKLRISLFSDSLLVSVVAISLMWYFFPLKESFSFAVGCGMGIVYSLLLGRYVERLGTSRENKATDGIRFVPVVILVLLFAKFKTIFSLIPELAGFITSYQLAAFLQAFNDDPYGEIGDEPNGEL